MTIKILAVAFLALALTACESATENANNSNDHKPAAASPAATPATTTASPASSPTANPATATPLKAGDKVKVTLNGSSSEAIVVSVDEKTGKAIVKIQGQKEDKTVAISAVSKQ